MVKGYHAPLAIPHLAAEEIMSDIMPHCMYSCIAVIDIRYLSFFTNRRKRQRRLLQV